MWYELLKSTTSKYHFLMVIVDITEGYRKLDAPQRVSLLSRNHTVKFNGAMLEVLMGQVHLLQGLQVHDVQASSAIHESLGEVIPVNAGTNNRSVALFRNHRRVVAPVIDTGVLRPLDVLQDYRNRGIEGSEGGFLLADRRSAQEGVVVSDTLFPKQIS